MDNYVVDNPLERWKCRDCGDKKTYLGYRFSKLGVRNRSCNACQALKQQTSKEEKLNIKIIDATHPYWGIIYRRWG